MNTAGEVNRLVFAEAAGRLRRLGFDVVSPAELPAPVLLPNDEEYNWRQRLARNLSAILTQRAEAVVVIPEWESAQGSILELHVAQFIGLKVYKLDSVLRAGKVVEG